VAILCLVSAELCVVARAPAAEADSPIACWWRTDRVAVLVGERFTVTLTCRAATDARGSVLIDPAQFDAGAVSLIPYEVIGVTHPDDVRATGRRYFQYEYSVRLIGTTSFGQAIDVPSFVIAYRVQSAEDKTPSRERAYALPALPMRVLSVVGPAASDIRDVAPVSFVRIANRRRRSLIELTAGGVAFGFAAVVFAGALIRSVRGRSRGPATARIPVLSRRAILSACLRETKELRRDVEHGGWTAAMVARACAVLRVAAAVALQQPIAETVVTRGERAREGQLLVHTGMIRPRYTKVSSAVTSLGMGQVIAASPPRRNRDLVASSLIADALGAFSAARFSRSTNYDEAALSDWLDRASEAIRRSRGPALPTVRGVRGTPATSALGTP